MKLVFTWQVTKLVVGWDLNLHDPFKGSYSCHCNAHPRAWLGRWWRFRQLLWSNARHCPNLNSCSLKELPHFYWSPRIQTVLWTTGLQSVCSLRKMGLALFRGNVSSISQGLMFCHQRTFYQLFPISSLFYFVGGRTPVCPWDAMFQS